MRQVFFSFRYDCDVWRAAQVRNMGKISSDSTFSDNDWEEVKRKSDYSIENWIDSQLKMRSCLVLLIGEHSKGRKWINYEIKKAWESGKGIVGIYIHGLEDATGNQANKGENPLNDFCIDTTFNFIAERTTPLDTNEVNLGSVSKAYDTPYYTSSNVYDFIKSNIEYWIEEAIAIRNQYPK